jgi:L-fuculose-phosphate aldolase
MSNQIYELRQQVAEVGRRLFERHLTDAAGGNVSARAGDVICMSPRFSGSQYNWQLRPEDVLVVDMQRKVLEGAGGISRESSVHFKLYQDYPDGGAVIHAHPRNVMVFAMARQPIYPVLEANVKFGVVKVSQYAPAHSTRLAEYLSAEFAGQEEAVRKQGAAVIAPWHGLFVLGKDILAAFDTVERVDTNAYCVLMGNLLPGMAGRTQKMISEELLQDQKLFKP